MDKFSYQYDNNILIVHPTSLQISKINDFINNLHDKHLQHFKQFLKMISLSSFQINREAKLVATEQSFDEALEILTKDCFVIIQDYNQSVNSYKGVISYISIGNSYGSYIIDCLVLQNHIKSLQRVFQNENIIKMINNPRLTLQNIKRDFSIFTINIFNLNFLSKFDYDLSHLNGLSSKPLSKTHRQIFNYLSSREFGLFKRPISQDLEQHLRQNFNSLAVITKQLGVTPCLNMKKPFEYYNKQLLLAYKNINENLQFIEGQQIMMTITIQPYKHEIQQKLMRQTSWQKNRFNEHLSVEKSLTKMELCFKQQKLLNKLMQYRCHLAKSRNVNEHLLLSDKFIKNLVFQKYGRKFVYKKQSTYQLVQRCFGEDKTQPRDGQIYKNLCLLIDLNEDLIEEEFQLESLFQNSNFQNTLCNMLNSSYQQNKKLDISKNFADISWGVNSEWLNANNDKAIKLYKQIISTEQFGSFIFQEFKTKLSSQILCNNRIYHYLKYAQYMRNNQYDKLQQYYQSVLVLQEEGIDNNSNWGQQDIQQKQEKIKDEEEIHYKEQQQFCSLNQKKEDYLPLEIQQKIINNGEQAENLLNIDILLKQNNIEPLPKNLKEIYEISIRTTNKEKKEEKKKRKKTSKNTLDYASWDKIQELFHFQNNLS